MEKLTTEEILTLQNSLLRKIIKHVYRYVPFYQQTFKNLGLTPNDILVAQDINKLPIISKDDFRKQTINFFAKNFKTKNCVCFSTSGTTGQPIKIYYNKNSLKFIYDLQKTGFIEKFRRLYGPGRILGTKGVITVNIIRPNSAFHTNLKALPRSSQHPCLSILDPLKKNMEILSRLQPDSIWTYGSYLEVMIHNLSERELKRIHPKVVVFTADGIKPNVRKAIESVWGCEVFGSYGSAETQGLGFECIDHSGYHLYEGICALRIINEHGNEAKVNERGELIISNLFNKATSLLNYRLGDLVVKGNNCPCGCPLLKITEIEGRKEDIIFLPNGKIISPRVIGDKFYSGFGIDQYQIIQKTKGEIEVLIFTKERNTREITKKLKKILKRLFSVDIRISVNYVKQIPPDPISGKIRSVISKIKN